MSSNQIPGTSRPHRADTMAILGQAIAAHQAGNLAQAKSLYHLVLSKDQRQFDALHMLGVLAGQSGEFIEANRLIRLALQVDARSFEALSNHARVLLELKQYEQALAAADRALALNPSYVNTHLFRGSALLLLRKRESALHSFDRALALKPDFAMALFNRGEALFELRRRDEALTAYQGAPLHKAEVDVAIDLMGHTEHSRPGILAHRPAPVQISYLGFPGTMGTEFIDYILADRIVLPFDQQPFFAEKIVHLPDSYQPTDSKRRVSACVRLTRQNLRREAERRGIEASRLVLSDRVDHADYVARQVLADLFLDTLPYNAHGTGSNALAGGLPVLTCRGETFAGRVGASLLHAVGLPELVTESLEEYEALALELARNRDHLRSLRRRLEANRPTCALFDTARLCRHLESAYEAMWDRHRRGEPPAGFSVAPPADASASNRRALHQIVSCQGRSARARCGRAFAPVFYRASGPCYLSGCCLRYVDPSSP
jgi:Tfp pilus assembly protein PilF